MTMKKDGNFQNHRERGKHVIMLKSLYRSQKRGQKEEFKEKADEKILQSRIANGGGRGVKEGGGIVEV